MRYRIRTYADVDGEDTSRLGEQIAAQRARVAARLESVQHLVAVVSGKGGVGKSLVAASLASAAARVGRTAGLLDADLSGPTAARFLGLQGARLGVDGDDAEPPRSDLDVRLVSTGLLLEDGVPLEWREPGSETFVWRGAQEAGVLREFLGDVRWGALDLLVLDLPPGPGRLEQLDDLVDGTAGLVAVTVPSAASRSAVERTLRLAAGRKLPLLGVVQNMSGYACPGCRTRRPLFAGAAGPELADRLGCPYLGEVPFDPRAAELADRGEMRRLLEATAAGEALAGVTEAMWERLTAGEEDEG